MSSKNTKTFFSSLAPRWDYWQNKNKFYYRHIHQLIQGAIPPQRRVLELGSGTGDLLSLLEPKVGVGINIAPELTELAKKKYPSLQFETSESEKLSTPKDFIPEFVVLCNMLDYVQDISSLLLELRKVVQDNSLLIITSSNPLWAPMFYLATLLKQRPNNPNRNFITNLDIANVLKVEGFDVVEIGHRVAIPRYIPILSFMLNTVIPDLPIIRYVCAVQYIVARPRIPRKNLSCSVVIPCHNEEDNIEECIRRVPQLGVWTEIIVVDDGSRDGIRKKVLEIMKRDSRVRLVTTDKNQGKANAVRAGFYKAKGDVLIILDADMTVAPEDLPKFFRPLENGIADFVNGTRLVYPKENGAMSFRNFLGNKAFCFLVSWIIRQRVSDTLCGTKAFFRNDEAYFQYKNEERWGDFDILFSAARLRLRIIEVPIHYFERRKGQSKMRVFYDGLLFLRACWNGWKMLRLPSLSPWKPKDFNQDLWQEQVN